MASITAQQAIRAADFIDSMGVNTHMGWLDTGYADAQKVAEQLDYIGLHNIRDGALWSGAIPQFQALGEHGIEATIFLPAGNLTDLDAALADIKALGSMVEAIEGPNEVDLWPVQYQGMTGDAAMQALQRDLFNKVNSDPALAHVEVDQYTIGDWTNYPKYSDASAYADFAVSHYYPNNGLAPSYGIPDNDGFDYARDVQEVVGGDDILRITETGYASGGGASGHPIAVDEAAQGKYIPRLFAEAFNHGIDTTYTYQLMDAWADQDPSDPEHWWGLFRPDGSPKPAATALHNLMSVIGDTDESFASTPLSYGLTGMPETADSLLLQKADGVYNLLLWNDVNVWNAQTKTSMDVASASVTLDFAVAPSQVILHNTMTGVSTTLAAAKQMTIEVPDHVVVLEVHAGDDTVEPPVVKPPVEEVPDSPANIVIGTGSDTIVLKISQDAWDGDAQYTISVDGQQIGGTLTAKSLHGSGQSDTVTVHGDWDAGDHQVSVNFINDAWGGTDDTDRNLHIDALTYNGVVSGNAAALYNNDAATFTVTDSTGTGETGSGEAGSGEAGSGTTIGSGTDSIVLHISQDAWGGDAQYAIQVDGQQIGGTLTAQASRSLGEYDTVTVKGSWAAGDHTLTVQFLNDAWGGTDDTDRNLYVEGITYDGEAVAGGTAAMMDPTPAVFTLTDRTAPEVDWAL